MSRPLIIKQNTLEEFADYLMTNLGKRKILFEDKLDVAFAIPTYDDKRRATINFSPIAYTKMLSLVNAFDSEVAWHGTVTRLEDNIFRIEDIIVYPQEVSGATVNTDQEGYEKWLMSLNEEQFNSLRMQGHSHVNMGVSPSSVDLNHQERIVEQLTGDDYYIFIIWNKRMDYTIKIFDLATNTLYTNADITITVGDGMLDADFISNAKALVKTKTYTPYCYTNSKVESKADTKADTGKTKSKKKKKQASLWWDRDEDEFPDEYDGNLDDIYEAWGFGK